MKPTLFTWAVAPALVAPLLLADTNTSSGEPGLVRVQSKPLAARNAPDASDWKDRLAARDLDKREEAFDQFVDALRRDPALRRSAEGWRDGSDQDLAWTSRLALRAAHADHAGDPIHAPFWERNLGGSDLRSRLDDMQRRFGDLDRMFDDFERRLNSGAGQLPRAGWQNGAEQSQQSYSLQMTPDGVKVEVEENVGGKREKRTYEAKSLDELYEKNPELKDKIGGNVHVFQGQRPFWQRDDDDDVFAGPLPPSGGMRTPQPFSGEMRTDRLGVGIGDLSADERKASSIDDGVGLKVASVEAGSVASKIGLEVGDVIVDVNGRTVHGAPDVLEVLSQRKSDQDIVVTVVDQDHKKRTLTWRAPATAGPKKSAERREY